MQFKWLSFSFDTWHYVSRILVILWTFVDVHADSSILYSSATAKLEQQATEIKKEKRKWQTKIQFNKELIHEDFLRHDVQYLRLESKVWPHLYHYFSPRIHQDIAWNERLSSLVYTTQVNSAFRAFWLACSEVPSKYYSPLSKRRKTDQLPRSKFHR